MIDFGFACEVEPGQKLK